MADFHLLRPWWLLALLPLALFYWQLLRVQKNQSGWHQWLPRHLSQVLVDSAGRKINWSAHRLALFWLISCVALAGPTWERLPQPVYQLETGQVVILDMSPSVMAEDVSPNRLTQIRFKAIDLVKSGLDGDTGLIAYADDAFIISPLTADNNNLINLIPSLSPQIMPAEGSEPLRALKQADELLKNAGYQEGDIYWITDGIASSELSRLSGYLRQQPHRVSILGVGTEEGAPVRDDNGQLIKDRFNQVVIAKLTPSRLESLAAISGGLYETVAANNSDIERLVSQPPLSRAGKDSEQQQQGDQWRDNGPFLALLLIPLMLLSWRRGGTLGSWLLAAWLPLSLFSPAGFSAVQQNTPAASQTDNAPGWWLNKEQQAQQLYRQQDYQQAAELSEQALRQGAAYYRAGEYQAAADRFAQLDSAESWYNRGNALAQMEQFEAAGEAYQKALEKRPQWSQAKENKELMDQLLQQQQQEQQEQNDNDNEDGDQGDEQDGQNQGNNQGQQDAQDSSSDSQSDDQQGQQQQQQNEQAEQGGNEQQEQEQQQPQPEEQQDNAADQMRDQQTQFSDDIDPEKARQLEQWMKRVPDDPSILLRNKMLLESRRRNARRASEPQGEKKKW